MLATAIERARPPKTPSLAGVPHIAIESVSKVYPSSTQNAAVSALNKVTLAVPRGAIYGVIGRSGSGKSTLLRLLNGLEKPTSGRVITDGAEVSALPEYALRAVRRRIGMIFQNFNLLSSRTVFENVALPLELAGVKSPAIERRVAPLLDLAGLADKKNRYPAELSGGQKQRVGIARALATEPAVLLSDEATSALDPETTQSILELLKEINRLTGLTIVLVTHEMQAVKSICGQVAVFDHGELIEEGPVYELFAHPKSELTRRFVAEVTGGGIPDDVAKRLSTVQTPGGQAVLRIVFTGQHATDPVLSRIARQLDAEINILSGQVDRIGGEPFGSLIVAVPPSDGIVDAFTHLLESYGLKAEVLGYVR
jgi:D-methionine transport system ATP-binding protein